MTNIAQWICVRRDLFGGHVVGPFVDARDAGETRVSMYLLRTPDRAFLFELPRGPIEMTALTS
jgi:hypothetical protein